MDHGSSQNLVSAYTFTVLNENKLLFLLEARWKGGGGGWRGYVQELAGEAKYGCGLVILNVAQPHINYVCMTC